jgi:arginine decarboxylase
VINVGKFKVLTGEDVDEKIYLKTWELDNETFEDKDKITKEQALEWFYSSEKSIIVLWNEQEKELVGYLYPFLLKHEFARDYILSDINYKEAIKPSVFCKKKDAVSGDIYIFSTVIKPKYRDVVLEDEEQLDIHNKKAFKILNEKLVEYIYKLKKNNVDIKYIMGEKVSDDGEKYLRSLKMQPCFSLVDDVKFSKKYSPDMFEKCENVNCLYELNNVEEYFDDKIIDNHEYLKYENGELCYKGINLCKLVKDYGAPLEVAYTPIITERINFLKKLFDSKINLYGYNGKYNYAYATKANYYSEVVLTALKDVDLLEFSSAYDINIVLSLVELGIIGPGFRIVCNGFKNNDYIEVLKKLLDKKIDVIPIIENEKEFEYLRDLKEYKINVGIRYNSDFESRLIKNDFTTEDEFDNRFGFDESKIYDIAEKIYKCSNLELKVFHFHFGGTITNIDNYIKGYGNIFDIYCKLKKKYNSLEYFDFGGGLPVKYSLDYEFNYDELVDKIVYTSLVLSNKNNIDHPQLIGEHGRYTVADHSFFIYKIDFAKQTKDNNWYIINGSLMNMTPDIWGINQEFTILPVNLTSNKCIPVILGGETCDPDDRYFLNNKNVKLLLPKINDGEELYVAIFSVGAYQEIISGIGGVHHCMIPEGKELIIYKDENDILNYYEPEPGQEVLSLLDYDKLDYISKFCKIKEYKN